MKNTALQIMQSWAAKEGNVNTTEELLAWIEKLNQTTNVDIHECSINESTFWFYDDYNGEILNRKRSFFSVKGIRMFKNKEFLKEQPIIVQPEIGYLGIICKEIDGVLNFLMQAKIEPGNVNCVQISPTIQATKSNFMRAHGGKLPLYFEYFENSNRYDVFYDQIQSEQSSRFLKKRNRNMMMCVNEEIPVYPNFKWMTLGQIKELMKIDNLVNMDTRTVLSGIPLSIYPYTDTELEHIRALFPQQEFFRSVFHAEPTVNLPEIYQFINNYKMFQDITTVEIPLNQLVDWKIDDYGVVCKKNADFLVRYYDISIEGREVKNWSQPLFKAIGSAVFGLVVTIDNGVMKYLVKAKPEIGCFDKIELAPAVQLETSHNEYYDDEVERIFRQRMNNHKGIVLDVVLSEEGGRFYHEQNRNVILRIDKEEINDLPEGYFWVDFGTLNFLVQTNNCLNIQLRNLLSLLPLSC